MVTKQLGIWNVLWLVEVNKAMATRLPKQVDKVHPFFQLKKQAYVTKNVSPVLVRSSNSDTSDSYNLGEDFSPAI